ncbi:MAG: L-threonine 3-dehydrogenase [Candidatus Aminicenantes bacterium]|nr:L-threonine 3-dehydrogenase [Candidatus Aminicenantes bacterium]
MTGMMKALRKMQAGPGLEMREIPIPAIQANEVLIQVHKRAICGTDLHIYKWDEWSQNRLKPPVTTGHEFYGAIVETGHDVRHYRVGELVTAEMHVVCKQCFQCRTGNAHLCENVVILGVDGNGCFAEYIAVPESNLWRVPMGIDPEFAAIYDPFGNAVHTVMAGATVGKSFLILGGGPIGIAAIPVCKAAGASLVLVSEIMPFRRELAMKMGADRVIDPGSENPAAIVAALTNGQGMDVVLEMSGHPAAIAQGFRSIRKNGRFSLLGIHSQPISMDLAKDIIFPGVTVQGINGRRMFETWYQMDALLVSGRVDLKPLITHRFKLEDFKTAFEVGLSGNAGKIILA